MTRKRESVSCWDVQQIDEDTACIGAADVFTCIWVSHQLASYQLPWIILSDDESTHAGPCEVNFSVYRTEVGGPHFRRSSEPAPVAHVLSDGSF